MGNYYCGMMNSRYARELRHHGILGQKWGVRRFQNSDGSLTPAGRERYGLDKNVIKNLKNARTANLDKWGKDAEHNTLYVTGYSGSGKSTTALGLKRKNDTLIQLDGYTEGGDGIEDIQSKKFNNYLDKNVPKWREIYKSAREESDIKRFSKEYFKIVDDFAEAINKYSSKEYANGNRVIVEGVQIADGWLGKPENIVGKPTIILNTSALTSVSRAFKRDDRGNLVKGLMNLDDPVEYIKQVNKWRKDINKLSKATDSRKAQKYINDLIAQY